MKNLKKLSNNSQGTAHHYILAALVIIVLAVVGVRVYMYSSAQSNTCRHDPAAAIEATPAGGTWNGHNHCYTLNPGNGITVTSPITIENATITDPVQFVSGVKRSQMQIIPLIHIKNTSNVTLSNLNLVGENPGGYHALPWVNEGGVVIDSATNVTITNVNTTNTFGDGLTLNTYPRKVHTSNITINGMKIVNPGREGVTAAIFDNSTLNNISISNPAYGGWSFQSDVGGGAGNVTINNCSGNGIGFMEPVTGPINFNNCSITGLVDVMPAATKNGQTITFNGGTITIPNNYGGIHLAGIEINGPGNLVVENLTIARKNPGGPELKGHAWAAINGAHITLTHDTVTPPLGYNDSSSTALVKHLKSK